MSFCYTDTTCSLTLPLPGTGTNQLIAPAGASLTGTTFSYNPLGQPSTGPVSITVAGAGFSRSLTVEADTGYVH